MMRSSMSVVLSLLIFFQVSNLHALNPATKLKHYVSQVKEFVPNENNLPDFIDLLLEARTFLKDLSFEESYQLKTKNIRDEITQLIRISQRGSLEKIRLAHEAFVRNNGGDEEGGIWETVMGWLKNPYVLGGIGIVSAITLWWAFGDQIKSFFGFGQSQGQDQIEKGPEETHPDSIKKDGEEEVPSTEFRDYVKSWVEENINKGNATKIIKEESFKYGDNVFIWAVRHGFLDIVNLLIPHLKEEVNDINDKWQTPLMVAAKYGRLEIVKVLLKHKDMKDAINKTDSIGMTALLYTTWSRSIKRKANYPKIARELINNKYLKEGVNHVANDGSSTLIYSANRYPIFKEVLKSKFLNFNVRNRYGNTVLGHAARWGDIEVVEDLLKDERVTSKIINLENNEGFTALMHASFWGRLKIVKMLLESEKLIEGQINEPTKKYGYHSLMLASTGRVRKNHRIMEVLFSSKKYMNNFRQNPLEFKDKVKGRTPLIWAASSPHLNIKSLKILLGSSHMNKKIFDMKDKEGQTAFLQLVTVDPSNYYSDERVNLFLNNKKYMDETSFRMSDKKGNNVLTLAVKSAYQPVLKAILVSPLLNKKMFHQQNHKGKTPLMVASSMFPNYTPFRKEYKFIVQQLLTHQHMDKKGFDLMDNDGNTAFMLSAKSGRYMATDVLLNHKYMNKSIFSLQNKKGETALIMAASGEETNSIGPLEENYISIVRFILDSDLLTKEVIKMTNKAGETAYEVANKNWHYKRAALIEATEKIFEDISKFSGEE